EHYNTERAHQSLENKIIEPKFDEIPIEGEIECDSRLGGMLNYYDRKAALKSGISISGHYGTTGSRSAENVNSLNPERFR
ncbi:MAG: hypothetical protein ACKVJX_17850, partial [Verrucomicrobiia bacterium]